VERVRPERLAAVAPRGPERDDGPREVDREHDRDDEEDPPVGVDGVLGDADEARDGERRNRDADEREHGGLAERGEVLGLPVPVLVAAVGRAPGNADREERQQRRDEVGA
jgi:hypothetical protein